MIEESTPMLIWSFDRLRMSGGILRPFGGQLKPANGDPVEPQAQGARGYG